MSAVATPRHSLKALVGAWVEVPDDLTISDITLDSRTVTPGAAFLACRGHAHHGLEYAQRAAARGARAILWESDPRVRPQPLDASILVREISDLRGKLGLIADRFFAAPSAHLAIAAITGTNGKTTCAWLLAQALARLGRRAAYLGTLGVGMPGIGASDTLSSAVSFPAASSAAAPSGPGSLSAGSTGALRALEHTTPDVVTMHRLLAELLGAGADSVAMEVSSHALDQDRCAGVRLSAAAFTNLTRDHLDYHADMAAYGAAKAKLFDWPNLAGRVINIDDGFGRTLAHRWLQQCMAGGAEGQDAVGHDAPRNGVAARLFLTSRQPAAAPSASALSATAVAAIEPSATVLSPGALLATARRYGAEYVCAPTISATLSGLTLKLQTSRGSARLTSPLRGHFNADNLLTVLALLLCWDVPLADACAALAHCPPPPGRMQSEGGGADLPLILIDYAHTPDALAQALAAARLHCEGRLWCIFGCGGERDPGKRSEMGRVAAAAADELIVTDDNPRGEDPRAIVAAIMQGVAASASASANDNASAAASGNAAAAAPAGARTCVIRDRGEAIRAAVLRAAPADVVLIAGKGHEDYQLIGRERRPFSDTAWVRSTLARRRPS